MQKRRDIKSLSREELGEFVSQAGIAGYRAAQIEQWLYEKCCSSFDEMTNLPRALRENLAKAFSLYTPKLLCRQVSRDGTRKYLFELADGETVETVGIPSAGKDRLTVCFSSQVGCPMRCTFCATGQAGFRRNLSSGEMFDQVALVSRDFGARVTNVVCMGQGEPFLNYDNTLEALRRMNTSPGLGIGARHITISTCGLIEKIRMFSHEKEQFTLAVSLHCALQPTRDLLMPGVSGEPLGKLRDALIYYASLTHRRPSLEYAPIEGINDDDSHISALVDFCSGVLCHVNLIPLNPIDGQESPDTMMAPSKRISHIKDVLLSNGIECSIRNSRGADIDGACGQLRQHLSR